MVFLPTDYRSVVQHSYRDAVGILWSRRRPQHLVMRWMTQITTPTRGLVNRFLLKFSNKFA